MHSPPVADSAAPHTGLILNLGCGLDYRPGAINVDRYDLTSVDVLADALRLPLAAACVEHIEARHLVEHLGYAGTIFALAEWRRVLAPGGTLLLETPDRPPTCRAAARASPPASSLHWLSGLPWRGQIHRTLFDEADLRALTEKAGLTPILIGRPRAPQPSLRLRAHKDTDTKADLWSRLHVGLAAGGVLDPVTAAPSLAHVETVCDRIVAAATELPQQGAEACLERIVGVGTRHDPRVVEVAIQILVAWERIPAAAARPYLALARSLVAEAFPARLAAWLRRHPSPPGTQAVRLQRLDDRVTRYLAARLFPNEPSLHSTREQFDAATAHITSSEQNVTFFCDQTVADLARRQTARGVQAFARGDLEAAQERFEAGMAYDADNALPVWNLARLALAQGHRLDALGHYARLLELLPTSIGFLRSELDAVTGRSPEALIRFAVPMGTCGDHHPPRGDEPLHPELPASDHICAHPPNRPTSPKFASGPTSLPDTQSSARPASAVRCCVWEITLACNLACTHCGATAGRPRPNELTHDEALLLAEDLAALPCQEVTLMGGELFLRPDWYVIAERLRAAGVALVLFTNGWLLDPAEGGTAAVERIAQIHTLAPRAVGLSLDGTRSEIHDAQRGVAGAMDRAWRALDALQTAGIPVSVITTLTRQNMYDLPALARCLRGRGIPWQVQVATCNGQRMDRADQLTPLEFYWAGAWLNSARQKYAWPLLPIAGAHDLGHHSMHLKSLLPPGCDWAGCTAGLDTVGIQSHGGVKGCLALPDAFLEGNVRQRRLSELWHDPAAFPLNRRFSQDQLQGFCAICQHGPSCRGGCSDLAHAATGSPYDNPYCFYRLEVAEREVGFPPATDTCRPDSSP
jgi:radical SAM protein with 4Fe4S-binding SPASM domain